MSSAIQQPSTSTLRAQQTLWPQVCLWWRRLVRITRRTPRRLRLCESLPLGERRFVAVVEFEKSRFLLGGTSASLVLLARLGETEGQVLGTDPREAAAERNAH